MSTLHDRSPQPRVWNERLALALRKLETGAQALSERTALLQARLDTHEQEQRRNALEPVRYLRAK